MATTLEWSLSRNRVFKNISLFTGAMGLDLGLERAGFKTLVTVEMDPWCVRTIRMNRPSLNVIPTEISRVSTDEILRAAGLALGEADLISGGPPCQPFSTAGKRGSIKDIRGQAFMEFLRVVREAKPKYFLIENVKGILSSAIDHRSLESRKDREFPLEANERPGSLLEFLMCEFDRLGYKVAYSLLNAADYGVAQIRERVFFIGSRDGVLPAFPQPTHSRDGSSGTHRWVTLSEIIPKDSGESSYLRIAPSRVKYMKLIPPGGNWKDLPRKMQEKAMGAAYYSGGGKTGFLRRLSFARPSPTLVTSPLSKATCLIHPLELRPLSVKEYALIQQFPDDWIISGNLAQQYRQIGNAVPIGLGYELGKVICEALESEVMAFPSSCSRKFKRAST